MRKSLLLVAIVIGLLWGCARQAPTWVSLESKLLPDPERIESPLVCLSNGVLNVRVADCSLQVRHRTDRELNRRFVDVSYRGARSANPYTYGNWPDPELGYTPPRWTVFEVTAAGPRCLSRLQAFQLTTERGDTLAPYTHPGGARPIVDALARDWPGTEETLTTARRILDQTYLRWGEGKDDPTQAGFLVFDPLDYAVDRLDLRLRLVVGDSSVWVSLPFRQHLARHDEPMK